MKRSDDEALEVASTSYQRLLAAFHGQNAELYARELETLVKETLDGDEYDQQQALTWLLNVSVAVASGLTHLLLETTGSNDAQEIFNRLDEFIRGLGAA